MTIDYSRMRAEWPKQKRALARAQKIEEPRVRLAAIEKVCIEAVTVWDEIGAWPDDWALFERALYDAAPNWREAMSLSDLMTEHRQRIIDREQHLADEAADAAERQRRALDEISSAQAAAEAALAAAQADAQREHDENYPEHAKLIALNGDNDTVARFLDWLDEEGYVIARVNENTDRLHPAYERKAEMIGKHFGIDEKVLDAEKRAMLALIRGEAGQ